GSANEHRPTQTDQSALIAGDGTLEHRIGHSRKATLGIVPIRGEAATPPESDHQIIPAIAIDVMPGDAGPELRKTARQEWLAIKIFEGIFVVRVLNPVAHVLEKRSDFRGFDGNSRCGGGLIDLIKAVWPRPFDHRLSASAPGHFDSKFVGGITGRKDPDGIVSGNISTTTDHFLHLDRNGAAPH